MKLKYPADGSSIFFNWIINMDNGHSAAFLLVITGFTNLPEGGMIQNLLTPKIEDN